MAHGVETAAVVGVDDPYTWIETIEHHAEPRTAGDGLVERVAKMLSKGAEEKLKTAKAKTGVVVPLLECSSADRPLE